MTELHGKTTDDEYDYAAADDAFTSEGARPVARPSLAQPERLRQMALLRIGYDGLRYHYNGYRYARLEDAIAYASLMRSRPAQEDTRGPYTQGIAPPPPTDAQRVLMASLAIRFEHGVYRFEDFRYDALADAVNYAKLAHQRLGTSLADLGDAARRAAPTKDFS